MYRNCLDDDDDDDDADDDDGAYEDDDEEDDMYTVNFLTRINALNITINQVMNKLNTVIDPDSALDQSKCCNIPSHGAAFGLRWTGKGGSRV